MIANIKHLGRILLMILIFALSGYVFSQYYDCWMADNSPADKIFLGISGVLLLSPLLYFALIGVLSNWFYREAPPLPDAELPVCTVIVPAYNEGRHILKSLRSIIQSDYPAEKLELIAVNDGSIDNTWEWMQHAAGEASGKLRDFKLINCDRNMGKRHALACGFRQGTGDVFVTIDSDSSVAPDALRRMVSPFTDARVGAVAGNVRVANVGNGIFPPMIDVGFTFSFDFLRTGQSVFGCVFCTPGAISAYRRDAVMPLLEEWVAQTFMGEPAGIGEDRALTNLVMRENYRVVMQRNAWISTNVPETYVGTSKMLLRWERSNIRENLNMFTFIFKDFHWNDAHRLFMLFTLLLYCQMTLVPVVMLGISFFNLWATNGLLLYNILAMSLLWSTLPAAVNLNRRSTKRVWYCYFSGVFHVLTLFWLVPYAFFTVRNSRWMTRMQANSAGKI